MQLTNPLLLLLTTILSASPSLTVAAINTNTHTNTAAAKITVRIPPSPPQLANPHLLPPSTRATLTTLGQRPHAAPLSAANTFVFANVSAPGSYLLDVRCPTHAFAPLRVDVLRASSGSSEDEGDAVVRVQAWETFRGNDWGNKGEVVVVREEEGGVVLDVRALGEKGYFMERSSFSVLSILKNPIILLSLVSMGLFFGMPKLVENMDPEMRAEWEERQKENPMNALMGAASGQNANPMSNFDMAAFLAGSSNKAEGGNGGKGNGDSKKKR